MSKFCVKKPFFVLVAVIVVLIIGGVSLSKMQTDLLPDMEVPYLIVVTTEPGASPEKVETENMKLAEFIKEYDERFNHILGYRRMTSWINHFNHTDYKPKRVHRIMKKLGIHSVIRKKKKKYTSSAPESIAENKLGRDFYACAPNEKWATDVTEFKVPDESKKLYLSVILDLYDRYPVAYVISPRNDNKLVFKTFDKALATNPEAKPLFHSGRIAIIYSLIILCPNTNS